MEFSWIDFMIGAAVMNAMPHFVVGIAKIRFLSLFGFTPTANLAYSVFNLLLALVLFQFEHGLPTLGRHGLFLGALAILVVYYHGQIFLRALPRKGNPLKGATVSVERVGPSRPDGRHGGRPPASSTRACRGPSAPGWALEPPTPRG